MASMKEIVTTFFEKEGWKAVPSIRRGKLIAGFEGENGKFECQATMEEEDGLFIFHSIREFQKVSENSWKAMMEFLTRVNCGMFIGNFEMDRDGNQVRLKTGIDVQNERLTPTLVGNVVYGNCFTMDNYLPVLEKIMKGEATLEEAMEMLEE